MQRFVEPAGGRFVQPRARLVENQQLGQWIERVGKQHAAELSARQNGNKTTLEPAQINPFEQP